MSQQDIIRAWKDAEFRLNLSEDQRSQLPDNPAGLIELSNTEMASFVGGRSGGTGGCRRSHRAGGCRTK